MSAVGATSVAPGKAGATRTAQAKKSGILGAGALYTIVGFVQRIASVALLPFFTRCLTPTEYGHVGFLAAVSGFAVYLFPLGLEAVVTRGWFATGSVEQRRGYAGDVQTALLQLPLLLAVPIAGVISIAGLAPGLSVVSILITLLSAAAFVAATVVPYGVLRAERRARTYVVLGLCYLAVQILTRLVLVGVMGTGVVGWVTADACGALLLLVLAPRAAGIRLQLGRLSLAARSALRSGLPLVPHGIGHWALALSDRLLLVHFVTLAAVGTYSVGYQVAGVLIACFTELNRAISPEYAALGSTDAAQQAGIRRLVAAQAGMVLAIGLAAGLVAPAAIRVLLPASYEDAAGVVPWVTLGAVFVGLYQISMNHLTLVRGQTDRIWRATVASTMVNVALNVATVPRFGIMAAAVNTAVAYGVLMVLVRGYEHRRTGGALRPDAALARSSVMVLTTALILGVLVRYTLSGLAELAGEVVVGASVVCVAGLLYWRAEQSWTSSGRIA